MRTLMGIVFEETPPPVFVEHEGWLCVMFWVKNTRDVRRAGQGLIDAYRDAGLTEPQVIVVDQSRAFIVNFDRARCIPSVEASL